MCQYKQISTQVKQQPFMSWHPDLPKCWNFISLSLPCRICPNWGPYHRWFFLLTCQPHCLRILSRAELGLKSLVLSPCLGDLLSTTVCVLHQTDGIPNLLERGACLLVDGAPPYVISPLLSLLGRLLCPHQVWGNLSLSDPLFILLGPRICML